MSNQVKASELFAKFLQDTKHTRITVGCFNHTEQSVINFYFDDADYYDEFYELLSSSETELTVECIEIDECSFNITSFKLLYSELSTMLEIIDEYSTAELYDFIKLFGLAELSNFEEHYTGYDDIKPIAQEHFDHLLSQIEDEKLRSIFECHFDFDSYRSTVAHDYIIGAYVWYN